MEAMRAALICASAALICSLIPRPEMRLGVVIAAGLCVMAFCLQPLREGAAMLRTLGAQSGADTGGVMIRAVGVAIVAEFGAMRNTRSTDTPPTSPQKSVLKEATTFAGPPQSVKTHRLHRKALSKSTAALLNKERLPQAPALVRAAKAPL